MKGAIMQPYFLPYIGYFQLISAVDVFVIYDNIKYTKKGWINRNRMLSNGGDVLFSIPIKKDSDSLDVVQRKLSVDFDRAKLLNQLKGAYLKASNFDSAYRLVEKILHFDNDNLFFFIFNSVKEICAYLDIETDIKISSEIGINHRLKSQEKVIAICKEIGVNCYINSMGGVELYSSSEFKKYDIELNFLRTNISPYPQGGVNFVSHLSIIDLLMHCDKEMVKSKLKDYSLVDAKLC
ncbi:WbqC family protein [Simplicispira hankyongi]|uniref:WbqC family protein n=1 Tax=Simplicispira hankyongi TaxID=2315688 RepID=A0A398CM63_9BURK|nr:WbqC family protein [Simplicispira hankyongi]RID99993.1 hypothetical protein D3F03_06365 [Simplicispira hankyongi]